MKGSRSASLDGAMESLPRAGRGSAVVRDLRRLLRSAAERRRAKVIVVEGPAPALEALAGGLRVLRALASPRLLKSRRGPETLEALARLGSGAFRVDDSVLDGLAEVETSQGVLMIVERPHWNLPSLLRGRDRPLVLVAHGIQDPGNLGALARVSEAAWGDALVCIGGADPWSPRSVRASAGSIPRHPILEYGSAMPAIEALRKAGLRLIGTSVHGSRSYTGSDLSGPTALFVGGEGAGLPSRVEEKMDEMISIPLRPGVDSLNVAAAAAVILFRRSAAGA